MITHGLALTALTVRVFCDASVFKPHNRNLRNSYIKLYFTFAKTEYLTKSIMFNGVELWNELPIEVKNSEKLIVGSTGCYVQQAVIVL